MRPWFLKFSDEAEARLIGAEWLVLREDGSYVEDVATTTWCYHVVGVIWRPAVTVYTLDGETYAEYEVDRLIEDADDAGYMKGSVGTTVQEELQWLIDRGTVVKSVTPATQKPGFHVNVLCEELPEGLEPYIANPETPDCIFAGYPDTRPSWGWGEKPADWVDE